MIGGDQLARLLIYCGLILRQAPTVLGTVDKVLVILYSQCSFGTILAVANYTFFWVIAGCGWAKLQE
jgi:hypothetical protein